MKKLLLILAMTTALGTNVYAEGTVGNTSKEIVPINVESNIFISQEKLNDEIDEMNKGSEVNVLFDENVVKYDVHPMYVNGKFMVPLRQTLEAMDYSVTWNEDEKSVEIYKDAQYTKLYTGKNSYIKNKMAPFELSAAPEIVQERALVPVEFFHEVLSIGLKIDENKITLVEQVNNEELNLLSTHSGFLIGAEKKDGIMRYHLSDEENGEVSLIVTVDNNNSYYQVVPEVGSNINIICSPTMLMSYPGQTIGHILY